MLHEQSKHVQSVSIVSLSTLCPSYMCACMWRVIPEHIVEKYKYSKLQNTLLHTSNMQECSNNFTKHIEMVIHWKMYFHIGSCKLLYTMYKIPKCYASSAYKPVFNSYLCASQNFKQLLQVIELFKALNEGSVLARIFVWPWEDFCL